MGRWAQRSRSGGGPALFNAMNGAMIVDTDRAVISFALPINAATFPAGAFTSNPSGALSTTIDVTGDDVNTTLDVTFDDSLATDVSVTQTGAVPGIQTPTTVSYT